MPVLHVVQCAFKVHSCSMAINQEHTMDNFDELAGRIDGVAHALLRLTAELEESRRQTTDKEQELHLERAERARDGDAEGERAARRAAAAGR